jgi:hypothetical protein
MARTDDPDTSHAAAYKLDATELEGLVFDAIDFFPEGCISDDVLQMMPDFRVDTISPRYAALLRKGYIIDTGERRPGRSGRSQRVMRVVQPGDIQPAAKPTKKKNMNYYDAFSDGYDHVLFRITLWLEKHDSDPHKRLAALALLQSLQR